MQPPITQSQQRRGSVGASGGSRLRKKPTRGVLLSQFEDLTPDFDTVMSINIESESSYTLCSYAHTRADKHTHAKKERKKQ